MDAADSAWLACARGSSFPLLVTLAPEEVEDAFLDQMAAAGRGDQRGPYRRQRRTYRGVAIPWCARLHSSLQCNAADHRAESQARSAPPLWTSTAWCGLVVDGIHVHAVSLKLALAARPEARMLLVTDAMSVLGTAAETFTLYGATIFRRNGRLEREDGTLAGADLDMATAVRNSVSMLGLRVERALRMASTYPAAFMRLPDRGRIAPGLRADLVLLTETLEVRGHLDRRRLGERRLAVGRLAPQALDAGAVGLALQTALLAPKGWSGRAALAWHDGRLRQQSHQTLDRIFPVAGLAPEALRENHDYPVLRHALAGQRRKTRAHPFGSSHPRCGYRTAVRRQSTPC